MEECGDAWPVRLHYQPDRTDDELDQVQRRFAGAQVPVMVAAEGRILNL